MQSRRSCGVLATLMLRPALALVLVNLAAAPALAEPVLKQARDVDNDGKPEMVEVDATGEMRIGTKKLTVGPLTTAKLSGAQFRGSALLVLETSTEAIVIGQKSGAWGVIARTPIR